MKIAILNVNNNLSKSLISPYEPFADPTPWLKEYTWERFYISNYGIESQINDILNDNFDIVLNLCDGASGEDRPGIQVVEFLEHNGLAYTGAKPDFYDPSRKEMKDACQKSSTAYPKSCTVNSAEEVNSIGNLVFPYIVKHPNSYNSVGLTKKSVVYNLVDLQTQVLLMIKDYQSAMIEDYIEGREFTALVVENPDNEREPIVFEPSEILFPSGEEFKHFDLKWLSHISMKYKPVSDKKISEQIKKMSTQMFLAMNGSGYARCDLRMNKQNELFMLEINPNCSIFFPKENPSSADEILFSELNGHQRFTDLIIKTAKKRYRKL